MSLFTNYIFAKKARLTPCKPALLCWIFGRFIKNHPFVNSPTYYTYLIFHEYENDVVFPLDMSFVSIVYSEMHSHDGNPYFNSNSDALNYPIKVLGNDKEMDDKVIDSGKFPNIKLVKTKGAGKIYAANICPHCNSLLGNYHLREKITDSFLKPNIPMDRFCEI